jgi:hypothetical protein
MNAFICFHSYILDLNFFFIILTFRVFIDSGFADRFIIVPYFLRGMSEEKQKEDTITAIKVMNRKWYNNRIFLAESLALGSLAFIGGFYGPLEAHQAAWYQALFFVAAAGFFVVLFSYLFNLLWIGLLFPKKKEESKEIKETRKQTSFDFYTNWKNRLFYSILQVLQSAVAIVLIIIVSLSLIMIHYVQYVNIVTGFILFANLFLYYDRFTIIFRQSLPKNIENKTLVILKSTAMYLLLIPLYPVLLIISLIDIFRTLSLKDKNSQDLFNARSTMYIEIFQETE